MKQCIITGASRGIGRAIALKLADKDRMLILHGRDVAALDEVSSAVVARGGQSRTVTADLRDPADITAMVASLNNTPVDVLVNNAGSALVKPVGEVSLDEWQEGFALNVTAPFLLTRDTLPMMSPGSTIVNVLSIAAKTGFPGWSSYCACKFALEGWSQSLREELRPKGIRVISLYPASTATDIWKAVPGDWPTERMMSPEEVAEALMYALSRPAEVLVEGISFGNIAGTL